MSVNEEEFDIEGNSICVGINWGSIPVENSYFYKQNHKPVDLNLSCVMINKDGRIEDSVTPKNRTAHHEAIKHSGDDKVGDKNGNDFLDNESLTIKLSKIDSEVSQLYIFVSAKKIDYDKLPHALFTVYNSEVNQVANTLVETDLKKSSSIQFADNILMCTIYQTKTGWKYKKNIDAFPTIKEIK